MDAGMITIVAGVSGSPTSLAALGVAADLAEQTNAVLDVLFVHDPGVAGAFAAAFEGSAECAIERSVDELESILRERAFDVLVDRPVAWTFDAVSGDAAQELVKHAIKCGARLLVVGGPNHHRLGGILVGSVAHKLVRCSPVSVLVVRDYDAEERHDERPNITI
jgi:nucleotide-binding universal stress UspA family protein